MKDDNLIYLLAEPDMYVYLVIIVGFMVFW
jgi:hypothetical protein